MPGPPGLTPVSARRPGCRPACGRPGAHQQVTALADRIAAPPLARV